MSGRLGPRFGVQKRTPKRGSFCQQNFCRRAKNSASFDCLRGYTTGFAYRWVSMILQRHEQLFATPCKHVCPHMLLNSIYKYAEDCVHHTLPRAKTIESIRVQKRLFERVQKRATAHHRSDQEILGRFFSMHWKIIWCETKLGVDELLRKQPSAWQKSLRKQLQFGVPRGSARRIRGAAEWTAYLTHLFRNQLAAARDEQSAKATISWCIFLHAWGCRYCKGAKVSG